MVLEQELLPYLTWLLGYPWADPGAFLNSALFRFFVTGVGLAIIALVVGYLVALVRYGPLKAGDITYRVVANGLKELPKTSPRRVWAMARLAIKESIRRRVIVALIVYALVLLFAGWFLKTGYQDPSKLFFSFVLTATTYIVLLIALLVSAFSLPQDFKSKTIYTVVTKPVRAGDIVLGRILGFTIVGTVLLALMAVGSYIFVWRMLDHTHSVDVASLENFNDKDGNLLYKKGHTSSSQGHRHEVEIEPSGEGKILAANGHEHRVLTTKRGDEEVYSVSGPTNMLRARVPQYGRLRFLDRKGSEAAKGISVGSEWTYRSFIEGGSDAAAIWTFDGINESVLQKDSDGSEYLPIELIVRVFRTYKGNIEKGIQGIIYLQNPDKGGDATMPIEIKSTPEVFTAKDDSLNQFNMPRKLYDAQQNEIDLLENLVSKDGRLEVRVQCLDRAQYFGFAQPDCFIRLPDGSPWWNFVKTQLSIWMQMVLVIAIGVTCSTVVNGPVAMLFTLGFITLGFFRQFFVDVATGKQIGGGPIESLVRIVTQRNQMTELNDSIGVQLMHAADAVLRTLMRSMTFVLPDFRSFSTVDYVAYGFNIPFNQIAQDLTVGLAYVAGLLVLGYFLLRTREVAK